MKILPPPLLGSYRPSNCQLPRHSIRELYSMHCHLFHTKKCPLPHLELPSLPRLKGKLRNVQAMNLGPSSYLKKLTDEVSIVQDCIRRQQFTPSTNAGKSNRDVHHLPVHHQELISYFPNLQAWEALLWYTITSNVVLERGKKLRELASVHWDLCDVRRHVSDVVLPEHMLIDILIYDYYICSF